MMPKKLFFIMLFIALFTSLNSQSQIIFSEDFDGVGGPTMGGPGTYTFPLGWSLRNVDNGTPAASVNYINEAWERREDFGENTSDSCAFSTSWTAPAGIANDWMWTPLIAIQPYTILSWNAKAYDPAYPDGYEVHVMTAASGPPTGGTGVIGNQITNSTTIFSVVSEATAWTNHEVDLSAYAGQSVYISFRNNSNDKFVLVVDDIIVRVTYPYDAKVTRSSPLSEYSIIPLQQAIPLALTAEITNNGINNLTNVQLRTNVYDASNVLVYTNTSAAVASMTPTTTLTFDCGLFSPSSTGIYTVKHFPVMNETDLVVSNDTVILYSPEYTNFEYARDDATVTGSLGIGSGNGGWIGQQFTINTATSMRSASMYVTRGYPNDRMAIVVWDMLAGLPNTVIGSTDTLFYSTDSARMYTLNMAGGPLALAPGEYVVTAVEFDSTLSLGNCQSIFTPGTLWIYWPTIPGGIWSNVESFGAGFAKTFVLRPSLYSCPVITENIVAVDASCPGCSDGQVNTNPSGGNAPYTFLWNTGDTTQNLSGVTTGNYTVTITDAFDCSILGSAFVDEAPLGIENYTSNLLIVPNPNHGTFNIVIKDYTANNGRIEVYNLIGEKIFETNIERTASLNQQINLGQVPTGNYTLHFTSEQYTMTKKLIVY